VRLRTRRDERYGLLLTELSYRAPHVERHIFERGRDVTLTSIIVFD